MVDAFSVFDLDGDGKVTEAELMQTLGKVNVGLTEEKIKQLVAEVDVDGDGELELNEFVELSMMEAREQRAARASRQDPLQRGMAWARTCGSLPRAEEPRHE